MTVTQLVTKPERDATKQQEVRDLIFATLDPLPTYLQNCTKPDDMLIYSAHAFDDALRNKKIDLFTCRGDYLSHLYVRTEIVQHLGKEVRADDKLLTAQEWYEKFFTYLESKRISISKTQ